MTSIGPSPEKPPGGPEMRPEGQAASTCGHPSIGPQHPPHPPPLESLRTLTFWGSGASLSDFLSGKPA